VREIFRALQLKPVHTVAETWDCRRKWRENGDSRTFLRPACSVDRA